jgi:hypothetical protein
MGRSPMRKGCPAIFGRLDRRTGSLSLDPREAGLSLDSREAKTGARVRAP